MSEEFTIKFCTEHDQDAEELMSPMPARVPGQILGEIVEGGTRLADFRKCKNDAYLMMLTKQVLAQVQRVFPGAVIHEEYGTDIQGNRTINLVVYKRHNEGNDFADVQSKLLTYEPLLRGNPAPTLEDALSEMRDVLMSSSGGAVHSRKAH